MVKIIPRCPTSWAYYRLSSLILGRWRLGSGRFAVGINPVAGEAKDYNPGFIETYPSETLGGENDCFHYQVDGLLDYYPPWYTRGSADESTGKGDITIGDYTLTSAFTACTTEVERGKIPAYPTTTVRLEKGSRRWSKYVVQLNGVNVVHHMTNENLGDSYFDIAWTETWTLIECRGDQVYPSSQGGTKRLNCRNTEVSWWTYGGSIAVTVPDLDFHIWSLEMPDGRASSFMDALRWRADEKCSFGDLSAQAAESVRALDINSVAYVKDIAQLGSLAKGLTSLANPGKGIKNVSKAVAKTYLAAHYGARLTVKDTQEIANAMSKYHTESVTKKDVQSVGASNSVVVMCPGDPNTPVAVDLHLYARISSLAKQDVNICERFKQMDRALMELDLAPTAANIWDMVPFSFVVDWFVPIGDALEQREIESYIRTLDVQAAFYSRKYTWAQRIQWTVSTGGTVSGPVTFKVYERKCTDKLALPPMRVDKPKGLSNHWVEASAIIVSGL